MLLANRKPVKDTAPKSSKQGIMYDRYVMSRGEKLRCIATAASFIFAAAYFAYRNLILALLAASLSLLYPAYVSRKKVNENKQQLTYQFRDALYSLSSSLRAGKSIETAFREALKDLAVQYNDPNSPILHELAIIQAKIEINISVEAALKDLAYRSDVEDIHNFVEVFQICNRTGGNLVQVIKNTADILNDKLEIRQEIETVLAERKFEQKILLLMPVMIILLLSSSAQDFIQPIFSTLTGRIVMTIAIALIGSAYLISEKIMNIEV